ncbi:MAG: flagellin [Campylobacterota bacterium]|nr:flagellin [Campylobacterota bacterium]
MTIDNNMNYINNINNTTNSTLEKLSSGLAINKASDDASGLAIADKLGVQKSSMAQSIDNFSSGIAMSNIAQDSISEQKTLLENIKTETLKAMNGTTSTEGREAIAEQINKYIDQYEQIADQTNYNGESLLKTNGDSSDDLSIVAEDSIVELQKSDTTSISDKLKSFMGDFVSNPSSMDSLLDTVDEGIGQLASFASDYGSASNSLESMARNYMSAQTNLANAQSEIADADISKMVTEFSKTDLQSQLGYLVQSQANAVQQRTVALLS